METSCILSRNGGSGTLDKALDNGGGILTAEDGNAGSFAGLLRGVKAGLGVAIAMGKGLRSKSIVLSGNPMSGVQGSG